MTKMTPSITKALLMSRPLYNPDPNTFVIRDIILQKDLRRVRLSDFAVVAFAMGIKCGAVTKTQVDIFESVYVRGAKVRALRKHEGRAALAPDGTVMVMGGEVYCGGSGQPGGQWTPDTVDQCAGYDDWIKRLLQTEDDMANRSIAQNLKNAPFPSQQEIDEANAYVAVKIAGTPKGKASEKKAVSKGQRDGGGRRAGIKAGKQVAVDEEDEGDKEDGSQDDIGIANNLINEITQQVETFRTLIQPHPALIRQGLYEILKGRLADILQLEWEEGPEGSDEGGSEVSGSNVGQEVVGEGDSEVSGSNVGQEGVGEGGSGGSQEAENVGAADEDTVANASPCRRRPGEKRLPKPAASTLKRKRKQVNRKRKRANH